MVIPSHPIGGNLILSSKVLGKLSPEDFATFCHEQKDLRIERNENGEIEIMAPAYSLTGRINAEINRQLANWNVQHRLGLVFDSSAGFYLDEERITMRSPDASFIFQERFDRLSTKDKEGFLPLCPDFIIELKSTSDSLIHLQEKMERYISYSAKLGWLIDVSHEIIYIYGEENHHDVYKGLEGTLSASPLLPSFELELSLLRN
ncbi:MAG: Uma2 family endonuclease [Bacteroidota bacterium]